MSFNGGGVSPSIIAECGFLSNEEDEKLFEEFSKELEMLISSDDYNTICDNINFDLTKFRKTKNIFIKNRCRIFKTSNG